VEEVSNTRYCGSGHSPAISGAEALRETARELEIVKTITEVARKEPKKVAAMLKLWLREE